MDRKNLGIECKIGLALIILVFIQASYGLQYEWKNWSGWSECNCFQSTNTDSVCTKNASRWRRQQTCVDKDTNDELTNCSYIPYEVEQCDKICNIQNKTETSPICKWSREWGNWSDCDYLYGDCGSGYQYQYPENCKCEDKIVQNKTLCGLTPIKARFCFDGCQGTCREIGHDTEAKRYEQTTRTTTFYNLTMDFTNRNTHVSIIRMELSMEVPCTYIDVIQKGVLINQYLLKEFKKSQYVEVYADQINMTMCLPFSTIYYFICDAPTYRDPIKPAACIRPGIGCGKNGTRTNMRSCVSRLNKVINNTFCYGVAQQVESCQVPCYNWGLWSQCVGCGHRATRSRKCYTDQAIDPHASDEGIVPNEMCVKQTKDESSYEELCFNDLEPCYDLRTWTQWSKINETTMTKQRNRTCIENGVKAVDMRMCNETKTMEYIEITSWTYWTHCGDPCLNIERMERTRDCIYNGQVNNTLCSDETLAEYRTCPPRECIKEDKANYTITINKTGCSVSCGLGTRTVTKTCIKNGTEEVLPSFCGIKDTATSMEECNMKQCVDILVPTYSVKISKSNCSGECGIGFRSITIKCLRDYNGKNESVDLELCGVDKNNQNKTEVCQLSNECKEESKWGSWTGTNDQCSTSCGGGRIRQRRLCLTGQNCIGDEARDIDCNENIPCPVDGGFTSWTNWTVCSTTCGSGLRMRVRECSNPSPLYGGKKCVGVTNETIKCNNKEQCSGTYVSSFGETCNLTCVDRGLVCVPFERKSEIEIQEIFKETFKQGCNNVTIQNVVDIETYGLVYMDRSGDCILEPQNGDTNFCRNESTKTFHRMCNCKSPGDLTYGPWTSWGSCNKDCGYGTKSRYRTCLNESKECEVDETQQQKNCNEFACPVDGNWGSWSQWSICSVTCGGGKRSRVRYCTNPTPVNGGRNCLGISEISEKCGDDQICPIHGGYDDWSTWSPCTPTCGQNRTRSRRRECDKPFPSLGGSDCIGPSRIEEQCSNASCMPVNIEGEMAICDDAYNLDTNDTITMKNHNLFMEIENRLQESINNFYSNLADEFKPKIVLHSIVRPTGKLSDVCKKSKKTD